MARPRSILVLAVAALTVNACAGTTRQDGAAGSDGAYPLKLVATNGAVTIPHEPRRIVSISASATEDLYAVGAGSQVVAVDAYSMYPPQAPRTTLSEASPDLEAIAKYRPDLVIVAEDPDNVIAQLQKLSIPVLYEPAAQNLTAAYSEIAQLARATGHAGAAAAVTARIKREIATIVGSVPRSRTPLRIYHELEPTLYSATSQTFIGQIYSMFGLVNIADKAHAAGPYPQLSAEYVIASNPDLIVLADTVCCKQSVASVSSRPGWSNITAVKTGDVVAVNDAVASHWGPRVVLFVRTVAQAVKRAEAGSA